MSTIYAVQRYSDDEDGGRVSEWYASRAAAEAEMARLQREAYDQRLWMHRPEVRANIENYKTTNAKLYELGSRGGDWLEAFDAERARREALSMTDWIAESGIEWSIDEAQLIGEPETVNVEWT